MKTCKGCGVELVTEGKDKTFCGDEATHPDECCDCFDVGWGMKPPVRLDRPAIARLSDPDDDKVK